MMDGLGIAMLPDKNYAPGQYTDHLWEGFQSVGSTQRHNSNVLNAWSQCFENSRMGFWYGVIEAAYQQGIDTNGLTANLDWQWQNNPGSITDARDQLSLLTETGVLGFMYNLMYGQRHNPAVMQSYRAAFRDDAQWLINKVRSY
jgi:hypothetical protein